METGIQSLSRMDRRSRQLVSLNRLFLWVLPILFLAAALDLAQWVQRWRKPLDPLTPSLEELRQPLPEVPALSLPSGLFEAAEPVQKKAAAVPIAVEEVQWKLKAVFVGETKRAYLEKEDGSGGVWLSEGEEVMDLRIKEIRERAVTVEAEAGTYDLRL